MCESCGCGDPHLVSVDVHDRVLSENDRQAAHNREHFAAAGVLAVNLMGSPGAGKTAVLEATARRLAGRRKLGAIAGDLATDHDAARLQRAGVPSRSITTGNACHLDAAMVHHALHHMAWSGLDILFIENVGNLVCPAVYDLGERANVVALSVTEGEDKPLKYPVMFKKADLVLVTKVDLLPHLPGVSVDHIWDALQRVMPEPRMLPFSATTGEGLDEWIEWLQDPSRTFRSEPSV
ncbi:MAG: hydrogenase nickel incorporation protein HypB [Acidobacteria bacterium]|nr:hydrogenase nickel incorporation protein HypB [Acidobacteriota bacterium]